MTREKKFVELFRWRHRDISWLVCSQGDKTYLNALLPGLHLPEGLVSPVCVRTPLALPLGLETLLPEDFPERVVEGVCLESIDKGVYFDGATCRGIPDFMRHDLPGGGRPFRCLKGSVGEMPLEVFVPADCGASEQTVLNALFTKGGRMKNMIPKDTRSEESLDQYVQKAKFESEGIPAKASKPNTSEDEDLPKVGPTPPTAKKVDVEDAIKFTSTQQGGGESNESPSEEPPPWEYTPGSECPPDEELGIVPPPEERKKQRDEANRKGEESESEAVKSEQEPDKGSEPDETVNTVPEQSETVDENDLLSLVDSAAKSVLVIQKSVGHLTDCLERIRTAAEREDTQKLDLGTVLDKLKEMVEPGK